METSTWLANERIQYSIKMLYHIRLKIKSVENMTKSKGKKEEKGKIRNSIEERAKQEIANKKKARTGNTSRNTYRNVIVTRGE